MKKVEQNKVNDSARAASRWKRDEQRSRAGGVRFKWTVLVILGTGWVHPALSAPLTQIQTPTYGQQFPPSSEASPPPRTIGQITKSLEARIDQTAKAAEVVVRASEDYHQGEALVEAGKLEEARRQFQRVQAIVTETGPELQDESLLRHFAQQVQHKLAAYNAGEGRVEQAMEATGVRDFWELARRGALPQETVDYVPSVLAAIRMLTRPTQYDFPTLTSEVTPLPVKPKADARSGQGQQTKISKELFMSLGRRPEAMKP